MYGVPLAVQTRVMLLALGLGFLIGILYDVFRIIRLSISRGRAAVFVQDILFFFLFSGITFAFCLSQNNGEVRFYIIFAEILGFLIYYFSFGAFVIRVSDKIINALRTLFELIIKAVSFPVALLFRVLRTIYRFFVKVGQKNSKKFGKKLKFLLQRNRSVLYNTFGKVFIQKNKNQKKLKKKSERNTTHGKSTP
ncbi:MAG: spore cortex biosynthesis protein YabQ [Oscillospiraceae bacterium]|jgi:spore cortex biosynthesis protein YabQ|nr:spore cortex biosynthesis protein YabQ [Oscillospiraceae bacterium]